MNVTVGWFEIPVSDMDRAIAFYEKVFSCTLSRNKMGPLDMAWFPWDNPEKGAGGALVCFPDFYHPGVQGPTIYFSCEDVSIEISKIEKLGGTVLQEKKEIAPGIGFMALFTDTEGNRIALHSRN